MFRNVRYSIPRQGGKTVCVYQMVLAGVLSSIKLLFTGSESLKSILPHYAYLVGKFCMQTDPPHQSMSHSHMAQGGN